MNQTKLRMLSPAESARITCQGNRWASCDKSPATLVEEVYWRAAGRLGTSFFYTCQACYDAKVAATKEPYP